MKLRISKIHEAAAARPPGYVEEVMSRGVLDGEWLEISDEAMAALRDQFRPKSPPPVKVMVTNLARAAVGEIKARAAGVSQLDADEVARRLDICQSCEHFIFGQSRCPICGCYLKFKSRLRSQHCPIGKW